jgi:L-alanine-DL-glutamate epimerase-like enolase superfamily enzyme
MPWYDKIYQEPTQVKDGFVQVPAAPGLGVELDENALKKYKLN